LSGKLFKIADQSDQHDRPISEKVYSIIALSSSFIPKQWIMKESDGRKGLTRPFSLLKTDTSSSNQMPVRVFQEKSEFRLDVVPKQERKTPDVVDIVI
jgi:hypothetical protein